MRFRPGAAPTRDFLESVECRRLKAGSDERRRLSARVNSCPDTKHVRSKRKKWSDVPSARAEALGRDDDVKGAEALGRDDNVKAGGGNRGPSTALRSAQDDTSIFWRFVEAGRRLAELHVNYEQQPEYALERVEKGRLNWRVEKMRLSKDKTTLVYNDFLTLKGIPPETFAYRLGNRSALEWVIDQYQVSTDKRSGIVNDPNRDDDPEYIVRLIGQVITVSLETMKIVKGLPALLVSDMKKSAAG